MARTLQLKLRYSDFSTITRAHSLPRGTSLDTEIYREIHQLFLANWNSGAAVRLLGVNASSWTDDETQLDLLADDAHERWRVALAAADRLRDKFANRRCLSLRDCAEHFASGRTKTRRGCPAKRAASR